MQTLQIFKAGNSDVVSIPKGLMRDLGLKTGQKVLVDKTPDGTALVYRKVRTKTKANKSAITKEFNKWLKSVLVEDKELLDELSVR